MKNLTQNQIKDIVIKLGKSIILVAASIVNPLLIIPVYFLVEFVSSKIFSEIPLEETKKAELASTFNPHLPIKQIPQTSHVTENRESVPQKETAETKSAEKPQKKRGYKRSAGTQKPYNKKPYNKKAPKTTQN